jgi:outer membrane protein TolC
MNTGHSPSPEFRARLEGDVINAWRREARFNGGGRTWIDPRRYRGLSLMLAGLILGLSTEFASGQVQDARERERILSASESERRLALMRVQMADETLAQARKNFSAGVGSRQTVSDAEAELRELQIAVRRLDTNRAEVEATSAPVRDELWAPLVAGRDFVTERLRLHAALAQDRLRRAEEKAEQMQQGFRAGVVTDAVVTEAHGEVEEAKAALDLVGMRLQVRREFLEKKLSPEEVSRRIQRMELQTLMRSTMNLLRQAEARLTAARQRARVGGVSELDLKRAELDVLELQVKLAQLEIARKSG